MPRWSMSCRATLTLAVKAITGTLGRYLATLRAVMPMREMTMMRLALTLVAVWTALAATASGLLAPCMIAAYMRLRCCVRSGSRCGRRSRGRRRDVSVIVGRERRVLAAAVSRSMTASAPSRTAAATSVTSARVGRGMRIIESSICVATMTGLPTALHLATIMRCAAKTLG